MSTLNELRDAIDHISTCTGDPQAWQRGLSAADLSAISASVIDPAAATALLAKIRANNAALFDPRTGAPVPPAAPADPPPGQQGDAATAIRKAESALAQQNSESAQVDLHVIAAILNAHAGTAEGSRRLGRLQQQVEDAVRMRTDLDTPAGAREFQRFLIGKLREIAAVIESASLDDTSKAALATAWTALYRSDAPVDQAPAGPGETPAPAKPQPPPPPVPEVLPPDGSDLGVGAMLDALIGSEQTAPAAAPPPVSPPPSSVPAPTAAAPPVPMSSLVPPLSSLPTSLPEAASAALRSQRPLDDDLGLDALLGAEDPMDPAEEEVPGEAPPDEGGEPAAEPPCEGTPPPDPTEVRLPDGAVVNAPSVPIARALASVLAGTAVVEAFGQQGIVVPPPGTAVAQPLDAAKVVGGDIGMFPDRQAVAVDRERAYFDGRIQPVTGIGGPSFLGWLHPPAPGAPAAAPLSPNPAATPTPTRPATAGTR